MMRRLLPAALAGFVALRSAAAPADSPPSPERTFTVERELWATPHVSQGETNTCWSFATTSFLESEAQRLGRGEFELSPMFTVHHAYREKALRHVRTHGANRFGDGGLPHDVLAVVRSAGALPRAVYPALADAATKHDHRELHPVLEGLLAGVLKAGAEETPLSGHWTGGRFAGKWFDAFRATLDAYLGAPPAAFSHAGRTLTPRQFADEVLRLPLDDYLEITAYSQLPAYGTGELLIPDNWMHRPLYNVPLEDFVRLVEHALKRGFSVLFDIHRVKDESLSRQTHLLGTDEEKGVRTDQDRRDTLLESWRTEDIHLVHAVGLARDGAGRRFYKVKDSLDLGSDPAGKHFNKDFVSEEFLRSRVLFVVVHKDALPPDLRTRLGLE